MTIRYAENVMIGEGTVNTQKLHKGWRMISDYILSYEGIILTKPDTSGNTCYELLYGDRAFICVGKDWVYIRPLSSVAQPHPPYVNVTEFLPEEASAYINYIRPIADGQQQKSKMVSDTVSSATALNIFLGDEYAIDPAI